MTGYGKSEVTSGNKKYTVEVRSLNGKNSDISLKSSILPKDKDLEFRQYLTKRLVRGNIDVFLTSETVSGSEARRIDPDLFRDYFRQLSDIAGSLNLLDPYGNVMSVRHRRFSESAGPVRKRHVRCPHVFGAPPSRCGGGR